VCEIITPPVGERSIVMSVSVCVCVCLSAIISSELHVRSSPHILGVLAMAVARFFSGGAVIGYVRYFWFYRRRKICSYDKVARRRRPADAQCTRSLGHGYRLYAVIPVASQRTHGTMLFGCLKQLPRWQHRDGVYGLCLPCFSRLSVAVRSRRPRGL